MRIGLVGYGAGGRWFHAPYIDAADGVELVGVVTRSPERIAELHAERPGMPVYASLTELLAAGVDAVAITTPPQTRRELVLEAIAAGVHVGLEEVERGLVVGGVELEGAGEGVAGSVRVAEPDQQVGGGFRLGERVRPPALGRQVEQVDLDAMLGGLEQVVGP